MRAALYLRQSVDLEDTGLAIARQRKDCLELCAARGWPTPTEYTDNNISATNRAKPRPAYRRMLDDIRAGKIDAVIAWDLDRLYRQPIELEELIDLADEHRLRLATVSGDADLSTDAGRLFARIKGAAARGEMERKSARQRNAAKQRAEMGLPWGPRRPFGYQADRVTINPTEADLLRHAYADFLSGKPLAAIARDWNDAKITTTTGKPWTGVALHQLMRNPRNAALRAYHHRRDGKPARMEIVGPAAWDPIVDEGTWRAAVARFTDPARRTGGGSNSPRYLLTGIARCGVCDDGTTVRKGQRPKDKVAFYMCPKSHLSRTAEYVENVVIAHVITRLQRADARELLVDDDREDINELRAQADELRSRMNTLAVEFADGELSATQLRAANDRIKARLQVVESQMAHFDRAPLLTELITATDTYATWKMLPLHRQRAVIDALCTVTIERSPKGPRFDPSSVRVEWRR